MILNGWKEIANHLGRGVRTVQRWEQLGLPVRRPNSRLRSAVICTTEELDAWVARCANGRPLPAATISHADLRQRLIDVRLKAEAVNQNTQRLMEQLQQIHNRAQARLRQRAIARSA